VIRTYLAAERNPGDQREAAALKLLAELLGGNPTTSVLARALQFDTQKAVYAAAFYDGMSLDADTFGFVVVPVPGQSLGDTEAALDAVLAKFLTDGVNAEEFARIKAQVRAAEIYGRDNVQGRARTYGAALSIGLSVQDVQDWAGILQDVTAEEVMAAANKVLNRKQAVTGWLTTEEAAE
jgi:zinc protease